MSLPRCPLQMDCPDYQNGGKVRDNWHRTHKPCRFFLNLTCEDGIRAEQKITGKAIACDINKGRKGAAEKPTNR